MDPPRVPRTLLGRPVAGVARPSWPVVGPSRVRRGSVVALARRRPDVAAWRARRDMGLRGCGPVVAAWLRDMGLSLWSVDPLWAL